VGVSCGAGVVRRYSLGGVLRSNQSRPVQLKSVIAVPRIKVDQPPLTVAPRADGRLPITNGMTEHNGNEMRLQLPCYEVNTLI
jgi:hypothetical protein